MPPLLPICAELQAALAARARAEAEAALWRQACRRLLLGARHLGFRVESGASIAPREWTGMVIIGAGGTGLFNAEVGLAVVEAGGAAKFWGPVGRVQR